MKNHLAEIDFSFGADWKTILHRTFFPPFTTHLQTGGHTASLPFYSIPPTHPISGLPQLTPDEVCSSHSMNTQKDGISH